MTFFPQKAATILQRERSPPLETPFEIFDRGVYTPNDSFVVRWHWAVIPTEDTPGATMKPGQTGLNMVPINKMVPRCFVTNLSRGGRETCPAGTVGHRS